MTAAINVEWKINFFINIQENFNMSPKRKLLQKETAKQHLKNASTMLPPQIQNDDQP